MHVIPHVSSFPPQIYLPELWDVVSVAALRLRWLNFTAGNPWNWERVREVPAMLGWPDEGVTMSWVRVRLSGSDPARTVEKM